MGEISLSDVIYVMDYVNRVNVKLNTIGLNLVLDTTPRKPFERGMYALMMYNWWTGNHYYMVVVDGNSWDDVCTAIIAVDGLEYIL